MWATFQWNEIVNSATLILWQGSNCMNVQQRDSITVCVGRRRCVLRNITVTAECNPHQPVPCELIKEAHWCNAKPWAVCAKVSTATAQYQLNSSTICIMHINENVGPISLYKFSHFFSIQLMNSLNFNYYKNRVGIKMENRIQLIPLTFR